VDSHFGVEFKAAEELGGDEEVLASAAAVFVGGGAGDVDEAGVDETGGMLLVGVDYVGEKSDGDVPFVARVHALVDLVDESEGCAG